MKFVQVSDVSDDMKMVTVVYVLSKLIFSQRRDRNGKQKSKCSKNASMSESPIRAILSDGRAVIQTRPQKRDHPDV